MSDSTRVACASFHVLVEILEWRSPKIACHSVGNGNEKLLKHMTLGILDVLLTECLPLRVEIEDVRLHSRNRAKAC
jgi:hypothetical protein